MREGLHYTPLPEDISASIRNFKQRARKQIGDVERVFRQVCQKTEEAIAEARLEEAQTGSAWPIVTGEAIASGTVSPETRVRIKRRGCVVVRQHFPVSRHWHGMPTCCAIWMKISLMHSTAGQETIFSAVLRHPVQKFTPFTGLRLKCRPVNARKCIRYSRF